MTVRSARKAIPMTFPLPEWIPDGISTAIFRPFSRFIFSITSQYAPVISRFSPTPNNASTNTVYSFSGMTVTMGIPKFLTICACNRHSSLIELSFPAKNTVTRTPFSCKSLAMANPSPPLFPEPHTINISEKSMFSLSITSIVFWAACSIKTTDGTPISRIV